MDQSFLSAHPGRLSGGLSPVRSQLLYLAAVKVHRQGTKRPDALAGRLLTLIASMCLARDVCQPGLRRLGDMLGRHPRSIMRSVVALRRAGLVTVRRRGKKLANLYRLSKTLWARLTNGVQPFRRQRKPRRPMQIDLQELFSRLREKAALARARGAPAGAPA